MGKIHLAIVSTVVDIAVAGLSEADTVATAVAIAGTIVCFCFPYLRAHHRFRKHVALAQGECGVLPSFCLVLYLFLFFCRFCKGDGLLNRKILVNYGSLVKALRASKPLVVRASAFIRAGAVSQGQTLPIHLDSFAILAVVQVVGLSDCRFLD